MLDKIISFIESLIFHTLFLAIIFFGMDLAKLSLSTNNVTPVKHVLLDEDAVLMELERLRRKEDFKNVTKQAQQNKLKQKKIEYERFISQERSYLKTLRQQQKQQKQQLQVLKQQRWKEEKTLKKLLRKKAKLEKTLN